MTRHRGWAERQYIIYRWHVLGKWFPGLFALVLGKVSPASISLPGQQKPVIQVSTLHVGSVPKQALHHTLLLLQCDLNLCLNPIVTCCPPTSSVMLMAP